MADLVSNLAPWAIVLVIALFGAIAVPKAVLALAKLWLAAEGESR